VKNIYIEHIGIFTRDLERLRSFYETYFGAVSGDIYRNKKNGFSSYFLKFSTGARLELMQMDSIPDSKDDPIIEFIGLVHFAISVGSIDAVNEMAAKLKVAGYSVVREPRKTGDGYYECVILDPDGNRVELCTS